MQTAHDSKEVRELFGISGISGNTEQCSTYDYGSIPIMVGDYGCNSACSLHP